MKKPNITPGPWKWVIHDHSMASLEGKRGERDHVLSFSPCSNCQKEGESPFGKCTGPNSEDAKAMEAVPDLIDSLIVAVEWMQWWLDEHECDCGMHHNCGRTEREHELSIMKDTLKKAGVTEL